MRSRSPACFRLALVCALAVVLCGIAMAIPFKRHKKANPALLADSTQLLLVITDTWDAHTGTLRRFERASVGSAWTQYGLPFSVVVGKNGLAWGRGLNQPPADGPVKREGDGKAPAGAFDIGTAFGQSRSMLPGLQLQYLNVLDDHVECVDDVKSRYYNRFITRRRAAKLDWESYEEMWSQPLYKWGAVVEHNTRKTESGAGSCIFLHIWKGPDSSTAGCTAMAEDDLVRTLIWLNPEKGPVLVQLPKSEYERLKGEWGLP